ncbi:DUF2623 family protein [Serratia entomophila]|uniref:DUF2623 family protein n=1 Tax=Serratia entomophila TaxID=42906 RepID=A0ABY5CN08_9GAMM|nr:DUF2623 family protein [Serratia entomophila]USU99410.1 DUF2623 family protein [Serratia entomophila]CAI0712001.1 Protein of uncharacterised function (DUF2623) [Serratia entomophila]CAI0713564.1 Protein of uncharacterised function (DUF2623) [Serratia entomophila]CAI0715366.1 Protein of uncharacterised function (DUF2623) [Serratia entomophila]CAI0715414.1 Protein of uncharacterised function (DUF2623) [Serratia entomophila]
MHNHFGKGLMAGLKAQSLKPAAELSKFCSDYKRGFVLGYAHHLAQSSGDENRAAFEAGRLCRAYGLSRDPTSEFFSGGASSLAEKFFCAGYNSTR